MLGASVLVPEENGPEMSRERCSSDLSGLAKSTLNSSVIKVLQQSSLVKRVLLCYSSVSCAVMG